MNKRPFFSAADILLPRDTDAAHFWPVIACDQFTSQPEYWEKLDRETGDVPSALRIILPEAFLSESGKRIPEIRRTMDEYLSGEIFTEYRDAMIFVERTLPSGLIRRGVIGSVSLDEYPAGLLRPTEATVPERVPPRAEIRRGAPLDMPHIMLFTNSSCAVPEKVTGDVLYDVPLRGGGGRIRGSLMSEKARRRFIKAIQPDKNPFSLAVGDGNHSLAAAKAAGMTRALVEVVSLHDPAIVFEPIYRVIKNADTDLLFSILPENVGTNKITVLSGKIEKEFYTPDLPVAAVDGIISRYIALRPGAEVDYIHGAEVLSGIVKDGRHAGFLFGGIAKDELFGYIAKNGVLPRKAFSMGTAYEKRYYMELMRSV